MEASYPIRRGSERPAFVPPVTEPLLETLVPGGEPRPAREHLAPLRSRWEAAARAERPFTYVNMVSTVDGRAALEGRSSDIGGPADLHVLLELRALADAVLIGTGTLRAEGYDRLVRSPERRARREAAGLAADPPAVLLSLSFDLPWDAGLFAAPEQPVLIYTTSDAEAPAVAAPVEVVRLPEPTPAAMMRDLRGRGIAVLLCEGGPTLNRALLGAGLVDELFLTLAPLLAGDPRQPGIVMGAPLPAPAGLALRWVLRDGDELYLRYASAARPD
jgi:riboflavin-specific deaminase-like protein